LHQIFEQELHWKDNKKIEISKSFILRFKNNKDNDYFYKYNLEKLNGLKLIQNDFIFIKELT